MGTLTEKRPDATSGSGKRMKMSARDAVGLIRRAKRRGAKVDVKPALAKPTGAVQKKAGCSLCAMAGGSGPETAPAGYSCPLCSGKGGTAGPALEAPRDSVQHKGAGTADAAEAQADVLGAQIGAELGGAGSVSSGPIPSGVRSVAERRLGVGLGGTELRADAGAHARTASVGALAMTEGSTVSFGAGQLSTSTAAGRSLLGHELTHVAQQRAHGTAARQGFLGFGDDDEEEQPAAAAPDSGPVPSLSGAGAAPPSEGDDGEPGGPPDEAEQGSGNVGVAEELLRRAGIDVGMVPDFLLDLIDEVVHIIPSSSGSGMALVITLPPFLLSPPREFFHQWVQQSASVSGPPIPLGGMVVKPQIGATLTLGMAYRVGPIEIRNISLTLDPLAGTYVGTGQLFSAVEIGPKLILEGAVSGTALTAIPGLQLYGGIKGTAGTPLIAVMTDTLTVGYSGGTPSFEVNATQDFGALAEMAVGVEMGLRHPLLPGAPLCFARWSLVDARRGVAWTSGVSVSGSPGGVSVATKPPTPIPLADLLTKAMRPGPAASGFNCPGLLSLAPGIPVPIGPPGPALPVSPPVVSPPVIKGPGIPVPPVSPPPAPPGGPAPGGAGAGPTPPAHCPDGSHDHPIPFPWKKRPDWYQPFVTEPDHVTHDPFAMSTLSDGSKVGIGTWAELSAPIFRTGHVSPGAGWYNQMLKKNGFDPVAHGLFGDHVVDYAFGGPSRDVSENLWPLDSVKNSSAGGSHGNTRVWYRPSPGQPCVKERISAISGRWFLATVS